MASRDSAHGQCDPISARREQPTNIAHHHRPGAAPGAAASFTGKPRRGPGRRGSEPGSGGARDVPLHPIYRLSKMRSCWKPSVFRRSRFLPHCDGYPPCEARYPAGAVAVELITVHESCAASCLNWRLRGEGGRGGDHRACGEQPVDIGHHQRPGSGSRGQQVRLITNCLRVPGECPKGRK